MNYKRIIFFLYMKSPRQRNYLVFNCNILKLVLKKYKKQWLMQHYAFRTQLQRD